MATIYDGVRVFTAAAGGTASSANQNTFQDQMILGMEERAQILGPEHGLPHQAATTWTFQCDAIDPPRWTCDCSAADNLIVPIPLRDKEYIVDITVLVTGADAPTGSGGEIGLYYSQIDTTTPTAAAMGSVQDLGGANPWDIAGAFAAYQQLNLNLSADMAAGERKYFLLLTSHAGGGASHARYFGTRINTRFHVGA